MYFNEHDNGTQALDKEMMRQQTEQAALNYNKILYSEWVSQVYEYWIDRCMKDDRVFEGGAKPLEKKWSKNWFKKMSNGYAMFDRINQITPEEGDDSYTSKDFFNNSQLSGMTKSESPLIKSYLSKK